MGRQEKLSKEAMMDALKTIGRALTTMLGEWCEVVVHDLADLQHSIVGISGNVSGRKIGGHMTDLGLSMLRSGQTEPLINYGISGADQKTLKASTVWIHDENGEPVATFCVNLDLTAPLLFDHFVHTLTSFGDRAEITESFSVDLSQMVEEIIVSCANQVGKPLSLMTKADRIRLAALLDERGVFQLRKSVTLIAKRLGVTEKTIYNYLAELGREQARPP